MKKLIKIIWTVIVMVCVLSCQKQDKTENIVGSGKSAAKTSALPEKPNVLLIVVDDLRYWSIKRLFEDAGIDVSDAVHGNRGGGNNTLPYTPNIDALIDGGNAVTFTNAHSTGTECCPSRTSFLFGRYPHQSGIYRNGNNWENGDGITPAKALTRQFVADSKYRVFGAGKIFHASAQNEGMYFNPGGDTGPYNNFFSTSMELTGSGFNVVAPANSVNGYTYNIIDFPASKDFSLNKADNVTQDAKAVTFCINSMQTVVDQNVGKTESEKKSFFVACGIRRPHSPLIVPDHIFHSTTNPIFPVNPKVLPADTSGLPDRAKYLINQNPNTPPDQLKVTNSAAWNNYVKAYAGAVTYMDEQVGRLINFIDNTPGLKANTIIVLISDHGVALGEKHHIKKTTLYEETTRVPMIWRVPGQGVGNPKYCRVPVDLMSVYPTLMKYCGITLPQGVNGREIKDLITNPGTEPDPDPSGIDLALTVMDQKSASIRTSLYRFTQYNDGGTTGQGVNSEELYNHAGTAYSYDPWEARDLRNVSPAPLFLDPIRNKLNVRTQTWTGMKGPIADE